MSIFPFSELSFHISLASICVSANNSLFAIVLWICGHDCHWLSELGVLEAHSLGGSLKCWGSIRGAKPFTPQGKAGSYLLLYGVVLGMGFTANMYLSLSYLFLCGYFFMWLVYRSLQLVLDFFWRKLLHV